VGLPESVPVAIFLSRSASAFWIAVGQIILIASNSDRMCQQASWR